MSDRTIPAASILAAGVGLGFAGDFFLRAPGAPGLNFTLLFLALAGSVAIVSRLGGPRLGSETVVLVALGALSGAGLAWRGSEVLRFFAFAAASTAFALAAFRGGRSWLKRGTVPDVIEALVGSALWSGLGSFRLFGREGWEVAGTSGRRARGWKIGRTVLLGLLLATVPLVVFGSLFMSADRVFAGAVQDFVRIDLQALASHLTLAAVLSWLACGYLTGFASGTRLDRLREAGLERPSLGIAEVATALGLVNLLFIGFVAVQFRYLFGGAGWVEVTPGLTYAEYAREGFFQLVAATALGLPWLLAADGLLRERDGTSRWIYRSFAAGQLLLLLAIVASAVQRMRVYVDAYGLSHDRFIAMAVLIWLALLVVWFGATVLRGRRSAFTLGALASAYALVATLLALNPAAVAARSQLDRAGGSRAAAVDVVPQDARYLVSLGSDAVPVILERIDDLRGKDRCIVARGLLERWRSDRPSDWRAWNAADAAARAHVRAAEGPLRAFVAADATCGEEAGAAAVELSPGEETALPPAR